MDIEDQLRLKIIFVLSNLYYVIVQLFCSIVNLVNRDFFSANENGNSLFHHFLRGKVQIIISALIWNAAFFKPPFLYHIFINKKNFFSERLPSKTLGTLYLHFR